MDDDSEEKKTKEIKKSVQQKGKLCLKITKITYFTIKSYQNHNKDLKVITTIYILKKPIRSC